MDFMQSCWFVGNGGYPIAVGPWGDHGGTQWDDGMYTRVSVGEGYDRVLAVRGKEDKKSFSKKSSISSSYSDSSDDCDTVVAVRGKQDSSSSSSSPSPPSSSDDDDDDDDEYLCKAIQIEYDRNGQSIWSAKHGGNGGDVTHRVPYRVMKEPVPSGPGPWGGDGGRPWDDGVYSGIRQILVTTGRVTAMRTEYDRNGQSDGGVTHTIRFEYPNEVLNCISGYYGCIEDYEGEVIKSLTFYTTRGKYGPYGKEIGTFFTSGTTRGKVAGFHGRSGSYLDAIGVHMQHWLGERRPAKLLISKFFG